MRPLTCQVSAVEALGRFSEFDISVVAALVQRQSLFRRAVGVFGCRTRL